MKEKMYNRKNIVYKQKSTTNKDFNVEVAVLYNTGMEIKMKFKAQKQLSIQERSKWEFEKYLTNSKGEKFEFTVGPRENGSASIDNEGMMTSTCMFDLTTFDSTDEITLNLEYKGNEADIVLEKVIQE